MNLNAPCDSKTTKEIETMMVDKKVASIVLLPNIARKQYFGS